MFIPALFHGLFWFIPKKNIWRLNEFLARDIDIDGIRVCARNERWNIEDGYRKKWKSELEQKFDDISIHMYMPSIIRMGIDVCNNYVCFSFAVPNFRSARQMRCVDTIKLCEWKGRQKRKWKKKRTRYESVLCCSHSTQVHYSGVYDIIGRGKKWVSPCGTNAVPFIRERWHNKNRNVSKL